MQNLMENLLELIQNENTAFRTEDIREYLTRYNLHSHSRSGIVTIYVYIAIIFAKRGHIHASNFATLMSHNFVYDYAITLKCSPTLV